MSSNQTNEVKMRDTQEWSDLYIVAGKYGKGSEMWRNKADKWYKRLNEVCSNNEDLKGTFWIMLDEIENADAVLEKLSEIVKKDILEAVVNL